MNNQHQPAYSLLWAILLSLFTLTAAASGNYTRLPDGVEITITDLHGKTRVMKVQVVTPYILHVTASAGNGFSADKSLMIEQVNRSIPTWEVKETKDAVILQTTSLHASISMATGEITFTDMDGKILLQETKGGGKTFTSTTLEGEQSYRIRQSFLTGKSEALYGLGQHQNGVFNYSGTPVILSQYNTEIGIPFLISSKNYGILWDNNSITKTVDTRDYEQLSTLKVFSKEGHQGWFTTTYYDKNNPGKVLLVRPESDIDFSNIPDLKKLPDSIKMDQMTVSWEGEIVSGFTGEHLFNLRSSGYTKLYIDGKLLANRWRQGWNPGFELVRVQLEKNKKYRFKIEWDPTSTESFVSCHWLKPVENNNEIAFESQAGSQVDYYFIAGKNMDGVISGYRQLTGKATLLPKWAMGFWQCRERYKTQEEVLSTVAEFRKRKIPLDNIVQDWSFWEEDQWGSQAFEKSRYPDAPGMIKTLHEKYNTQFMISVWPKFYENTVNYKILNDSGWMFRRNIANRLKDFKGYHSSFYDAFHPRARNVFWNMMDTSLFKIGVDAWWMDATEPDVISNLSETQRKEFSGPNYLGSSTKYFNAFPLVNSQAVYEGQRRTDPNKRVFILTRSAFAGLQRYASASWSGDIGSTWEDFKLQIPAGLNFCMSGLPYWTTDIGGFAVQPKWEKPNAADLEEWRELQARWYQYGAFCPLFRQHGQFPFREIFNIAPEGHPAYESMLYYNKLRYRLMPYIYSLAGKTYYDDYTIMRGLPMDFGEDEKVLNIADQFMFGPSILVNPVYEYKSRSRQVYLPNNTGWYDFYTGKFFNGGQTITADAPYGNLPLYIKAGSIIPCGPNIQYVAEKATAPFTIYVFAGADASFSLYEDEGVNFNYEKNQFSHIKFNYNEASKTLTIADRRGSFNGMQKNRSFNIVFISQAKKGNINFVTDTGETVKYNGKKLTIKMM